MECHDDTFDEIRASRFVTVSLDGSTDSSVQEKEIIYVTFINADGHPKCKFFCLADVSDATSIGNKTLLMETCAKLDLRNQLVSICIDGAAVNLGVHHGLSALLKEDMPWLVAAHCMNHRLELASKDACSTSFLDEISTMLLNLHYMYEKSPKRPDKANGTSGYVKKLTSFKCVLHTLFYECLLNPLASFLCSLQADSVDLSFCIAKLKSLLSSLEHLKGDTLDSTSELAKFIMSGDCEQDRSEFRSVMLTAIRQNVLDAFHNSRSAYVDAISSCLNNRFDDLQSSSVMKGVKTLNVSAWPSDNSSDSFGLEEISGVIEHFKPLLLKHDIVVASIIDDWRAFKTYWAGVKQIKGTNIWAMLLRCHRKQFPNVASLIEILHLLLKGWTALMKASSERHDGCVQILLENGVNINQKNKRSSKTPLLSREGARRPPQKLKLVTASGGSLPIVDYVEATVVLGNTEMKHYFVVVKDLITPVILGVDFIQEKGLVLDFTTTPVTVTPSKERSTQNQQKNHYIPLELAPALEAEKQRRSKFCAALSVVDDNSEELRGVSSPHLMTMQMLNFQSSLNLASTLQYKSSKIYSS
eukprot:Em0003g934a